MSVATTRTLSILFKYDGTTASWCGLVKAAYNMQRLERRPNATPSIPAVEWAPPVLALVADAVAGAGIVPTSTIRLLRVLVMLVLYRDWTWAIAAGYILPWVVPLTFVSFLHSRWHALWVSAIMLILSAAYFKRDNKIAYRLPCSAGFV